MTRPSDPTGDRSDARWPVARGAQDPAAVEDDALFDEDDDDIVAARRQRRRQARAGRRRPAAADGAMAPREHEDTPPTDEPTSADGAPAPATDHVSAAPDGGLEEFDPELDEVDDDIVTRRAARGGRKVASDRPAMSKGERAIIAIGAVVGVLLGLWFMGRPAATTAAPEASATASAAADAAQRAAQITQWTQALEQNPDDADAHVNLAILMLDSGDMAAATSHLQAAARLEPAKAEPWYYLGFVHLSATPPDYEAAQRAWDKVVELEPDSDYAKTVSTHIAGLMSATTPSAAATPSTASPSPSTEAG